MQKRLFRPLLLRASSPLWLFRAMQGGWLNSPANPSWRIVQALPQRVRPFRPRLLGRSVLVLEMMVLDKVAAENLKICSID